MKSLRVFLGVCLILAVAAAAFASGQKEAAAPAKVTIWYETNLDTAIKRLNPMFEDQSPDIDVEWVKQDASQLSPKLIAALAGGVGPDLVIASQKRLSPAEMQLEAWSDISQYMSSDSGLASAVDALPDSHVKGYTRDGKVWGLPFFVRHVGLFLRESWMEEVGGSIPEDWQEMTDLAKKLTTEERFGYGIFGAAGTTSTAGFQFMYSAPAAGIEYPILDASGKPNFDSDRAKRVAEWFYRWQHVDKITAPATPSWTHKEFYAAVQAGQVAMGRVGGWNVNSWENSDHPGKDFVVFEYPPMEKGQADPNYQYTWNDGISMQGEPKNPQATVTFLKFLLSKDAQGVFVEELTSWAREDLEFERYLGDNPRLLYFARQHPFAPDMAYHQNFLPVMEILSKHLNALLADSSKDPEQTMEDAYEESMKKYREIN